jgi:hypothetical protein
MTAWHSSSDGITANKLIFDDYFMVIKGLDMVDIGKLYNFVRRCKWSAALLARDGR